MNKYLSWLKNICLLPIKGLCVNHASGRLIAYGMEFCDFQEWAARERIACKIECVRFSPLLSGSDTHVGLQGPVESAFGNPVIEGG
jgi:hypothetical protein